MEVSTYEPSEVSHSFLMFATAFALCCRLREELMEKFFGYFVPFFFLISFVLTFLHSFFLLLHRGVDGDVCLLYLSPFVTGVGLTVS